MLVIAPVADPDWNGREGPSETFGVRRVFACDRRDRSEHRRVANGNSPDAPGWLWPLEVANTRRPTSRTPEAEQ
jgi:hypothetical protein